MEWSASLEEMLGTLSISFAGSRPELVGRDLEDGPLVERQNGEPVVGLVPDVSAAVGVEIDEAAELAILVDRLSHRLTHLEEAEESAAVPAATDSPRPMLAGLAGALVDDVVADVHRLQERPGMAAKRDAYYDALYAGRPDLEALPDGAEAVERVFRASLAAGVDERAVRGGAPNGVVADVMQLVAEETTALEQSRRATLATVIVDSLRGALDEEALDVAESYAGELLESPVVDVLEHREVETVVLEEYPEDPPEVPPLLEEHEPDGSPPDVEIDVDPEWEDRVDQLTDDAPAEAEVQRQRERRDKRARNVYANVNAETVRDTMRKSGLVSAIEDAFDELTEDVAPEPTRSGPTLDVRNAIRRVAGDYSVDRVYQERSITETATRTVTVALDLSGSMDELAAKKAVAAVAQATEIIGDELGVIAFDSTTEFVTDPGEEWEWSHLDAVRGSGGTNLAKGMEEALSLLHLAGNDDHVLFVVTDAQAHADQPRAVVRGAREDGVGVIGFGVGNVDDRTLDAVFGTETSEPGYVTTDSDRLATDLVEAYRGQLDLVQDGRTNGGLSA